ncbi:MAG: hypothetical protein HQK75_13500 [Candidatus Magnetomorum sp.]|nr:hypothetical protein [Candidatus Magnetomorum sp.]
MIGYVMQSVRKWTGLSGPESQEESTEDCGLFDFITDTGAFRNLCTTLLPEIVNVIPQTLNALGHSLEKESAKDQTKDLSDLLQRLNIDKWSETFSTWLTISKTVQSESPLFLSQHLNQAVSTFLKKIDFVDLKDFLKQTAQDINALSENINAVLWDYPAKMVLLCSLIPLAGNTACLIARNTLKHFNVVPPDVLADITISLIKELDVQQFSQFLDEAAELVRKFHTGSALIGEPGSDALSQQVNRIFDTLTSTIDKKTMFKAKQAIWKMKTSFHDARMTAISKDPEQLANAIHLWFNRQNNQINTITQLAEVLDHLPDDILSKTIGNHIQEMDLTEGAETINIIVQLILRLNELEPDALHSSLFQWLGALDMDALGDMADQVAPHVMENLTPIIQRVAQPFIHAFCDAMEKDASFGLALKRFQNEVIA